MSSYQLTSIANTDAVKNSDVFSEQGYMGRLFIFEITNPSLVAMGIKSEWFLLSRGGEISSGHINSSGEWSISPRRSLEPTHSFAPQAEVFNKVFSSQKEKSVSTQLWAALQDLHSLPSNLHKDVRVNVERTDASGNADGDADDDAIAPVAPLSAVSDAIFPISAAALNSKKSETDSFDEDEEALAEEETSTLLEEEEEVSSSRETKLPVEVDKSDNPGVDEDRNFIQDTLIEQVLIEYEERETTEFVLPPFGSVTVHIEENYFVLRSDLNGHTILSATLDKEVLAELALDDATEFSELFRASEIEMPRLADAVTQEEDDEQRQATKSKGFEYD